MTSNRAFSIEASYVHQSSNRQFLKKAGTKNYDYKSQLHNYVYHISSSLASPPLVKVKIIIDICMP